MDHQRALVVCCVAVEGRSGGVGEALDALYKVGLFFFELPTGEQIAVAQLKLRMIAIWSREGQPSLSLI